MHHLTVGSGADIFLLHGWGASSSAFSFVLDALGLGSELLGVFFCPGRARESGIPRDGSRLCGVRCDAGARNSEGSPRVRGGRPRARGRTRRGKGDLGGAQLRRESGARDSGETSRAGGGSGARGQRGTAPEETAVLSYPRRAPQTSETPGRQRTKRHYDETPLLARIACPTAVFWGDRDRETPLYMAKRFVRGIEGSRLFMLSGGHFAYAEDPDRFMRVLIAFVRALTN